MIRLMTTLIFAGLLMVSAERASAEGKRVALVVGISSYASAPKLPNAGNDANAMADLFRKAGFDVVTARSDVSNLEFKRTIRDFEDSAFDADIAVVFYAGYGIRGGPGASPRDPRPDVRRERPPGLHLPLDRDGWGLPGLRL